MTVNDEFDRTLADWFETESESGRPATGIERVFAITGRGRPRTAWLAGPGSRWVGRTVGTRTSSGRPIGFGLGLRLSPVVVLLLLGVAIIGGVMFVGGQVSPLPQPGGQTGRLAYVLDGAVFLADQDGGNPVRISGSTTTGQACGGAGIEGPLWSPDGQYLAYRQGSGPDCTPGVRISDMHGNAVSSFQAEGWQVAWAPDSRRLATWGKVFETFEVRGVDGQLQADIPLPVGYGVYGDYDPIWSGDGASLVIRMRRDPGGQPSEFWLLPVDGGSARRFLENARICCLSYSPDRALVAYLAFSTDGLPGSLLVSPADAPSTARTVASDMSPASIGRPIWSPAGDLVAVTGGSINDAGTESTYELQVVDIATGGLTSLPSKSATEPPRALAFSPDGERLLFSEVNADGMSSLWSVTLDGSGVPRLIVAGATWGEWQPTVR